jgi:hypothetical protein
MIKTSVICYTKDKFNLYFIGTEKDVRDTLYKYWIIHQLRNTPAKLDFRKLDNQYFIGKLTVHDIPSKFGVSVATVYGWGVALKAVGDKDFIQMSEDYFRKNMTDTKLTKHLDKTKDLYILEMEAR